MLNIMKKLSLLLVVLVALAACASEGSSDSEEGEENQSEESAEGKTQEKETVGNNEELVIDLDSTPSSLDPHAANDGISLYVMTNIYDTLVRMNQDLELEPSLAKSYEQVNETTWEFKLREDVTFHDGEPFNAEVVKMNLDRVLDPEVGATLSFLFDMIDEVEVVDDYTVQIHTQYPFSALPAHLAHPGGHMISPKSIEADYEGMENGENPLTAVNENPVGTGYYELEEHNSGENVILTKNEDYWGEKPNFERIVFKAVPEESSRVSELLTDEADIIYPVNTDKVSSINESEEGRVKESESASMSYLGFNVEKEPLDNREVRRAINMAIDKEALVEGLMSGVPLPAAGPLAPTVNGYSDELELIEHNVEKAKEILEEEGYEEGFSLDVYVYDKTTADTAVYIQSELEELNIELNIEQLDIGAYLDLTAQGEHDMLVGSWGTVTLDADYGLYPMFHSENAGSAGNRSFFSHDEVDQLLEEARRSNDEEKRLELYEEAQQIIIDESPIVPLYHSVLLAGLSEDIEGFYQYPSSFPYLKDVKKSE
ncbi:glutathione ABC transporter substrate-binding protein [Alkalibacillus sp. S2W]|uniref:glutathione ABC transporter substrate-binding protein n=1 Tax=Alkalibacillus sp. S2W TaxID=3386553 RepID=UPI00398D0E83